jgi:hypothetical protein
MAAAVKDELDEQRARGRKIKFVSCCNSPGKKVGTVLELWQQERNEPSGIQVQGEREQTRAGCRSYPA